MKYHIYITIPRPFTQYFVEAPLAVISSSSLLGFDATSLAHLYLGSFSHSSLHILLSSVSLDGEHRCTAIFRSLQRCSIDESYNLSAILKMIYPLKKNTKKRVNMCHSISERHTYTIHVSIVSRLKNPSLTCVLPFTCTD